MKLYSNKIKMSQVSIEPMPSQVTSSHPNHYTIKSELEIRSSVFLANGSFFAQKWVNERFAQKHDWFTHSLIFGEQPERWAHNRSHPSFFVSNLSDLPTSLRGNEQSWSNRSHRSPKKRKWVKMSDSLIFQYNFFIVYKTY